MSSATKQQMVINYVPGEECRVAVLEDGRLEEFHTERAGSVSFVGNIYVGRVTNVEPSIQAAFVDFGLESNGFLHVSDIHPMYFPGSDDKTEQIGRKTPRRERPPIQACLRRGQEIVVQVLKEGINTKGPTLTSYISIPGRYLVMLPDMDRVGVSRKVEDEELRREMRQALDSLELPEGFGFILRTAGEGKGKAELKRDLAYLQRLWKDIERRRKGGNKPRLLYAESDLLMRVLRDLWTTEVSEIVIDDESALRRAGRFMKIVSPRSATKLLKYDRPTPVFHAFGIEEQIARIHAREVPLPGGGSLVIDETEAMIAIDVNSGKMRHHGDAETTAYKTNVEAVDEICRQLRLRDVGGLVLCDLIDMMSRSHRRDIENRFKERLKRDRAATKTLPISQFGIVEMTRQRQKQSLRNTHYAKCPSCTGRGMLKRPDSVADDAMRELAALLEHEKVHKVELVVSPRVAGELLSHKRKTLGRLEFVTRKHADVRVSEDIPVDRVSFYAYDELGADIDLERLPRAKPPTTLGEWAEKGAAAEEWAVDILQEEATLPAEAFQGAGDEESSGDELILADALPEDDDEDDADAPEPLSPDLRSAESVLDNQSQGGRKRRRRRRRGRGRGTARSASRRRSRAP
ncbi:MAG TPA: ribonuclease E [Phycisphaerales bacterium]|nr:ribonuclease E [Phycisphaerales bacterium]